MNKKKHIVLGVTGSIAAYKACDILRLFVKEGHDVSVVLTKEAEKFVTALTFTSLAGKNVYQDYAFVADDGKMPHIELARSADLVLIAPATANIIGKLANGLADDLLSCLLLATRAPILIAPAMNTEMYTHPSVEANCQKLKKLGIKFIDPIEGKLACGTTGQGHLAEVDDIVNNILRSLKK